MENKDFFDTITEAINEIKGWSKVTYENYSVNCGYDKSCIDEYSEEVEYRRIFLSHYYNKLLYDHELDFDGKPLGTAAGAAYTAELEKIMRRRQSVAGYIKKSMSFEGYRDLIKIYNLAT